MVSFTDQKPQIVNEQHLAARWRGGRPGEHFRCYLCGHKFTIGEYWRWIYGQGRAINFITCKICDGSDVLERWAKKVKEAEESFWWLVQDCTICQHNMLEGLAKTLEQEKNNLMIDIDHHLRMRP